MVGVGVKVRSQGRGSRSGIKEGVSRSGVKGRGSWSGSRSGEVFGAWGQESRRGVMSGGGYGGWGQGAHGFSGRRLEIKRECSFQELKIEFHSIPFQSIAFHTIPCFTLCHIFVCENCIVWMRG